MPKHGKIPWVVYSPAAVCIARQRHIEQEALDHEHRILRHSAYRPGPADARASCSRTILSCQTDPPRGEFAAGRHRRLRAHLHAQSRRNAGPAHRHRKPRRRQRRHRSRACGARSTRWLHPAVRHLGALHLRRDSQPGNAFRPGAGLHADTQRPRQPENRHGARLSASEFDSRVGRFCETQSR